MEGMPDAAKPFFLKGKPALLLCLTLICGSQFGCLGHGPEPYRNYAVEPESTESRLIERTNAYSDYLSAAQELDEALIKHPGLLNKSTFSANDQKILEKAAVQPLRRIKIAMQKVCRIPYAPPLTEDATKGRAEWRILAKVLVWRVQNSVANKDYGVAIYDEILLTKFGFDLVAGLPNDASLGLISVDEGRRALAPSLTDMSVGQLETLSKAIKTVFLTRPSIEICYGYAEKDSLETVQDIQDVYRKAAYPDLDKKFGSTSKEIAPVLKDLHDQPDSKRVSFFDGFAQEAKDQAQRLKENSSLAVALRTVPATSKSGPERPWKKISRRLLGVGELVEKMNDQTCTKTKLLILDCQIVRSLKMNGKTPPNLNHFSGKVVTDPYSGQPFAYSSNGTDYKLYSVGEDLIDNDGETDESYNRPDMWLEKPH